MREAGYYWVKMITGGPDFERWEICFWNPIDKTWQWFGNLIHEQQEQYEFEEINETRIKNPDES